VRQPAAVGQLVLHFVLQPEVLVGLHELLDQAADAGADRLAIGVADLHTEQRSRLAPTTFPRSG
jgi:hypothetical protein